MIEKVDEKMTRDTYSDFQELLTRETEGVDFTIEIEDRNTDTVIVGIHGGFIEPDTELVVREIAGTDLSYYLFLGKERYQHITSSHFNEERCLHLVSKSKTVISIHGKQGEEAFVMLGGLAEPLIHKASKVLREEGFNVQQPEPDVMGESVGNICNKGITGEGLQIELSRGLRNLFLNDKQQLVIFAKIIRELTRHN